MIFGVSFDQLWQTVEPTAAGLMTFAVGTGIASGALYFSYIKHKADELRRSEVHKWADEVILVGRKLVAICTLQEQHFGEEEVLKALHEVTYATTALVDRGRLFFRNDDNEDWGADKSPAYRGYRAKILDPIVIFYKIACKFQSADSTTRMRMGLVADDCIRKFVSLAQKEVGRVRTASHETARPGDGSNLDRLMAGMETLRVQYAMRNRPGNH